MNQVVVGDCLEVAKGLSGFEAAIADLPAGVSFMGLKFDVDHGGRDKWVEYMAARLRAMREACIPGAYGLFWSLPRTSHWTAMAIEAAGYKIIDSVAHLQGQGWPKSKGQLKPAREDWILCRDPRGKVRPLNIDGCRVRRSWAERPESWHRSGHSAKPEAAKIAGAPPGNGIDVHPGGSWPPDLILSHASCCRCVGARKVKAAHHTGDTTKAYPKGGYGSTRGDGLIVSHVDRDGTETIPAWECLAACACGLASPCAAGGAPANCPGCGDERWWACPVAEMDAQSGESTSPGKTGRGAGGQHGRYGEIGAQGTIECPADSGGASRFFPCFFYDAKAARAERQSGCEGLLWVRDKAAGIGWRRVQRDEYDRSDPKERATGNVHATVKPVGCGADDGFMRWAVRLLTPECGAVFDGTMGSGGTAIACQIEGREFDGCDIDPGAVDIAKARLAFWTPERHRQVLRSRAALTAATSPAKQTGPAQIDLFTAMTGRDQ